MCGGFHNEAEVGFKFSPKVIEHFLRKLYDGDFDTSTEIEPTAWREVLRILNAAVAEGVSQSAAPPTLESDFYKELRQSNGVFAAFKVHSMAEKMAALLTDADGKLKPFYQWKAEVEGIASHYVGPWLRTEYNTAVIRAHNAADWLQFERNRDIMPNLRWMPTTSPNPEAEHRRFWSVKLTRPIDDPFWNKHRPGDRWNCKCSLEATDEPPTDIPDDADDEKPQRGLRGNPAKTGQIFDKSHPYFPKNCASCGFNRRNGTITSLLRGWFNRDRDCYYCPFIKGCIDRHEEKKHIDAATNAKKAEVIEKKLMPRMGKQPCEAVVTKNLNRTNKVRDALLKHCFHVYDVEAAVFIWNNPNVLKEPTPEELGAGKDTSSDKDRRNIDRKRNKLNFIGFNVYKFTHNGRNFTMKMAVCKKEYVKKNGKTKVKTYEQFYAIYEEM